MPEKTKQRVAIAIVNAAIYRGELTRPNRCELCCAEDIFTVGHHWRGYDFPLDVWWICRSCNRKLKGIHDASLTKEQAQEKVNRYEFYPRANADSKPI